MIINKKTNGFITRKDKPNENWLKNDDYFFIDDNSALAKKIINNYPYIRFKIENDVLIDVIVDDELKNSIEKRLVVETEIKTIKQKLFDTDYQVLKYVEGHLTEEDYASVKEKRQAWRDEINELEAILEVQNENH